MNGPAWFFAAAIAITVVNLGSFFWSKKRIEKWAAAHSLELTSLEWLLGSKEFYLMSNQGFQFKATFIDQDHGWMKAIVFVGMPLSICFGAIQVKKLA